MATRHQLPGMRWVLWLRNSSLRNGVLTGVYLSCVFVSGLTAWTLLTFTYMAMEMNFSLLESRMGAFHIFMLGGITYGFVAVFHWVFLLCVEARQRHVAQSEHVSVSASRPHVH